MTYDFCFLVSEYTGGGIARVITDIANQLAKNGKKGAIVSLHAHDRYKLKAEESIDIIHLDEQSFFKSLLGLKEWIKSHNPKAVIACDKAISRKMILATRVLSHFQGKVIVFQSQRLVPRSAKDDEMDSLSIRLLKWLYEKADLIIAKSKTLKDELLQILPPEKVRLIPIPIDIQSIQLEAQEPIPHPWLTYKMMPVIVSMGRMVPEKGFETLLRAFSLAKERRPLRLILLGEGYHKNYLEQLAKNLGLSDSVSFVGFTSNPYIYLKNADLFVLSSEHEGFSLALAEALACGCNVVVTDCCKEPIELLKNGELGTLVPPSSSVHMEKAILERLDHLIPSSVLQEQVKDYDIPVIAKEYEVLLS